NNGIAGLDLTANYKEFAIEKYDESQHDCFILNKNNTMSILRYIENNSSYKNLWILSMLLDKKINGKLSAKISSGDFWCSSCRSDVKFYQFDVNCKFYNAIETGDKHKCVDCVEEALQIYTHGKLISNYEINKYGN